MNKEREYEQVGQGRMFKNYSKISPVVLKE